MTFLEFRDLGRIEPPWFQSLLDKEDKVTMKIRVKKNAKRCSFQLARGGSPHGVPLMAPCCGVVIFSIMWKTRLRVG